MTVPIRFSILVAVQNRPPLVRQTIDAVLAQTFTNYELIVVDDGSTDDTPDVVRSYGPRVLLLQQPRLGPEAARSRAAAVAQGEYLVGLDSDDLLYPEALAIYDKIITEFSPPLILGSMSYFRDGEPVPPNASAADWIECLCLPDFLSKDRSIGLSYSILVIKRSTALETGALRAQATAFPFDTPDVLLRSGTCGPLVQVLRPFTLAYRLHASNTVKQFDYLIESLPVLTRLERLGSYPGGRARQFERRAYIGTISGAYFLLALKRRRFVPAAKLLMQAAPMMAVGVLSLLRRALRPKRPTVVIEGVKRDAFAVAAIARRN